MHDPLKSIAVPEELNKNRNYHVLVPNDTLL